jgi:hypothetical protein
MYFPISGLQKLLHEMVFTTEEKESMIHNDDYFWLHTATS